MKKVDNIALSREGEDEWLWKEDELHGYTVKTAYNKLHNEISGEERTAYNKLHNEINGEERNLYEFF